MHSLVDRLDGHLVDDILFAIIFAPACRPHTSMIRSSHYPFGPFALLMRFACDKSAPGIMKGSRTSRTYGEVTWLSYVAYSFLENGSCATQPHPSIAPDFKSISPWILILRTSTADSPYRAIIGMGIILGRYNMIGPHLFHLIRT